MLLRSFLLRSLLAAFALVHLTGPASGTPSDKTYKASWKRVDSLDHAGLPKSALQEVLQIGQQAQKDRNDPQYVKSVMYRLKLGSEFQENFPAEAVHILQEEVSSSTGILNNVLRSLLAEVTWSYASQNAWRFASRVQTAEADTSGFETWDLARLGREATRQYLLSVANPAVLQQASMTDWSAIMVSSSSLEKDPDIDPSLRPTLYDFLLQRALNYLTQAQDPGLKAAYAFRLDKIEYFSLSGEFVQFSFTSRDSASNDYFAAILYQDAERFHLKDKDPKVLINYELSRLSFVSQNAHLLGRDSLYLSALRQLLTNYAANPSSAPVSYALASFLDLQGQQYDPLVSQAHRGQRKEALGICDDAVRKFPKETGSKNCAELARQIRGSEMHFTTENAVIPGKPFLALLNFRNLVQANFRIVRLDPDTYPERMSSMTREEILKFLASQPVTEAWSVTLPAETDFQPHAAEVRMPALTAGFYATLVSPDQSFSKAEAGFEYATFQVTRISYISRQDEEGGHQFYVADRETGVPLGDVRAEAFSRSYNYMSRSWVNHKTGDYKSDAKGYFALPAPAKNAPENNTFVKFTWKEDTFNTGYFYLFSRTEQPAKPQMQTSFFLDRGIYRPGQTIWFKGILTERTGSRYVIKPGVKTVITLKDANGQKVSDLSLTSDDFGSVHGSFIAPLGVLTGMMTISNESGSVAFQVEEYRRPTFEVTFNPAEGNYKLEAPVTVTGKAAAYAGNSIDGAQVRFRVVRMARFPLWENWWRRPFPASPDMEILNGTTVTGSDGTFSVTFPALADLTIDPSEEPVFDFTVYADVTDLNGETQSSSTTVSAGYTSLLIGSTIPERLNLKADTSFLVTTTNSGGRPTPASVKVTVEKLRPPQTAFLSRGWQQPDTAVLNSQDYHKDFAFHAYRDEDQPSSWPVAESISSFTLQTSADTVLTLQKLFPGLLEPGAYRIRLSAKDPFGQPVEKKIFVTAFSPAATTLAVPAFNWFLPLKTSGNPGENASFLIGSSEKVTVLYEVRMHDSLVSSEWKTIAGGQERIDIPILEAYRGNFSVSCSFISHNRVFTNSTVVNVPYSDKKLRIAVESFRDRLLPGEKEQWKIRITEPSGKPAAAQFLASMYDASLDVFRSNDWAFSLYPEYFYFLPWEGQDNFRIISGIGFPPEVKHTDIRIAGPDRLNWFGLWFQGAGAGGRGVFTRNSLPAAADNMKKEQAVPEAEATATGVAGVIPSEKPSATPKPAPALQIRRDFRETAFFYPDLLTDSTGSLLLQFIMPEALTRWKMQGLAYTKELDYGLITKELVTRKDLMVFPNAPRFVRYGDTLAFRVKVVNLSDHDLSGTVTLQLSDPLLSKPVDSLLHNFNHNKPFAVKKGESVFVSYSLIIPADGTLQALQYRVTAQSGDFSDGEEKTIPVLPNRMMVTESLPLPVRGKGTFDFTFAKMAAALSQPQNTLKSYRLTLEFASNPAWYAIQALPSLNETTYPSADRVFDAFYSNSLASFIANSDPKIRQVFESWQALSPDAFLSALEKNQDLKTSLLAETPWVLEAKDESREKQRLGLYFNPDNLAANLSNNLSLLKKMQKPDGGWPWFEGMPESRFVTQDIVLGLGRLNHLGVKGIKSDPSVQSMVERAIIFLDGELQKEFDELKARYPGKMNENHLSALDAQYLYARSFFTYPSNDVVKYYTSQAATYWLSQSLSVQALIALALNRTGNTLVPPSIIKSLSEKALHSDELGMYWAQDPGYSWQNAPVETQSLMIEAYDEVAHDPVSVEALQVWLLKQKQTRMWKTPHATADACYAILLRGVGQLATEPGVKIRVGNEKIDPQKLEGKGAAAGTGYFRLSWSGTEISPEMSKVSVTKSTSGIAWGALYWQYFENLDKITGYKTPLSLAKEVYVLRDSPTGPVLEEMKGKGSGMRDAANLHVGDKVTIRIVLKVDRDMEFVQLKDMRAAGLEPAEQLSGYRYQGGLGYYMAPGDLSTSFFFDYLPKGTYVFEYSLKANSAGDYSNGIATVQCLYAPEFNSHSEGIRIRIGE